MNKSELISAIAIETGLSKKNVNVFLDSFTEVTARVLEKGERVQLSGFGIFDVGERAARKGRNPGTGERIKIKASKYPRYKASKVLKERIDK